MSEAKSLQAIEAELKQLREWISTQAQLPKNIEDRLLHRFLHSCYYDIEKTKTTITLFFGLRGSSPELVTKRDPLSDQVQKTLSIVNLARLEISGNRNLWIWQLNDPGLDKYDYVQDAKLFFLCTDAWLLTDDKLEDNDVVLLDVKDISLKFITKFNLSCAKKLAKYQEEALPIRLKQVHLVNTPSFIDKLFGLIRPLMKQEITEMIHFHTPNSESLYKYLSKDDLPEDYGGTRGKLADHTKQVSDLLLSQREHFLDDNLWRSINTKNNKKAKGDESNEVGSFRSLAID